MRSRGLLAAFCCYLYMGIAWGSVGLPCALEIAEHPPSGSVAAYLAAFDLQTQPFDIEEHRLWDNWVAFDSRFGIYHRYTQSAPRKPRLGARSADSAHDDAGIRHFVSADGREWFHLGMSLEKSSRDELAYWSGRLVVHGRRYFLFHTRGETSGERQYIALSESLDGHRFLKSRPVLLPAPRFGYGYNDADGRIPAWRDPDVQWSAALQRWVMLFAAKRFDGENWVPAIGVAVSRNLRRWRLRRPLELRIPEWLPAGSQLELPNLIACADGTIRVLASYTIFGGEERTELGAAVWRGEALGDRFEPQNDDGRILRGTAFYGLNLLSGDPAGSAYLFSTERHPLPYRLHDARLSAVCGDGPVRPLDAATFAPARLIAP